MNIITQEAKKKQAVVKFAKKNGKSAASRMYGVSLFKRVIKLQRSFAKLRGGHSAVLLENAAKIQHILIAERFVVVSRSRARCIRTSVRYSFGDFPVNSLKT